MATKIYLKQPLNSDTSLGQAYSYANPVQSVLSPTTSVTNTSASGTSIQWTVTGGGTALKWISRPLYAAVTIAGTVTLNVWGSTNNAASNTGFSFTIKQYTAGAEGGTVLTSASGVPLTTSAANYNWTGAPTSTTFNIGDRIVIYGFVVNVGTMAGGDTVTVNYGGKTSAASGDVWVQFTEKIQFQNEAEFIQGISATSAANATTLTATFPGTCASPNMTLAWATVGSQTPSAAVTDNQSGGSNTYVTPTHGGPINWNSTTNFDQIFYSANIIGGSALALTVTLTGGNAGAGGMVLVIEEWAGLQAAPFDQSASTNNNSTSLVSGIITPTNANCLVIGITNFVTTTISSVPAKQIAHVSGSNLYDYVLSAFVYSASDTFGRADSNPIGGNWSPISGFGNAQILSNVVVPVSTGTNTYISWNPVSFSNDQSSQVTVQQDTNNSYVGLVMRVTGTTFYQVFWQGTLGNSSPFTIQPCVGGSFGSNIGFASVTLNAGDTIACKAQGSWFTLYHNGALLPFAGGTGLDISGINSGSPGIMVISNGSPVTQCQLNNWTGNALVGIEATLNAAQNWVGFAASFNTLIIPPPPIYMLVHS